MTPRLLSEVLTIDNDYDQLKGRSIHILAGWYISSNHFHWYNPSHVCCIWIQQTVVVVWCGVVCLYIYIYILSWNCFVCWHWNSPLSTCKSQPNHTPPLFPSIPPRSAYLKLSICAQDTEVQQARSHSTLRLCRPIVLANSISSQYLSRKIIVIYDIGNCLYY